MHMLGYNKLIPTLSTQLPTVARQAVRQGTGPGNEGQRAHECAVFPVNAVHDRVRGRRREFRRIRCMWLPNFMERMHASNQVP